MNFSSALTTLTPLEQKAVFHVFREMDGKDGTLVTSKLAGKIGITRTVIVNALRKLESAGLIKTKSSGMKGTHIRILNDIVYTELDNFYREQRNS
jgi:transcriptional pleiotropic repressor